MLSSWYRVSRRAGWLCFWAGLLGVASGAFLIFVEPAVAKDIYSYPLSVAGFAIIQVWFALQHLGLFAGIMGLEYSGATAGRKRGVRTAGAGMLLLALTEIAAIAATKSHYPSTGTTVLDILYTISVAAVGGGLVACGIAIVRGGGWTGPGRWVPLATGIYAFVPMMPMMVAGYLPARLGISGWMALFAVLGWLLARKGAQDAA